MPDVPLTLVIIGTVSPVVAGAIPLIVWWIRDSGREQRERAERLAAEQLQLSQEMRRECVKLLRAARDFRVLVENTHDSRGSDLATNVRRIRQLAAEITGQADDVGFMVLAVETTASSLAAEARMLAATAAESKNRDPGVSLSPDFARFDRCLAEFRAAALAALSDRSAIIVGGAGKVAVAELPTFPVGRETVFNINRPLGSKYVEAEYDDFPGMFSGRDSGTAVAVLDGLDIQVYLANGENYAAVESALNDFIEVLHIEVLDRGNPEFGSWFRRMKGKITSETPSIEEVIELAVRAVQMKTMLWPQAGIDAAQGDVLAKLITALGPERNAVIQIGSILLVKSNGDLMCRNLTQAELSYLERNPTLIKDPSSILRQLQDASSAVLQTAQEPCSCGSGRPARECHLARS
jgi:hypothetical protein